MRIKKSTFSFLILGLVSCGYLSNDHFFSDSILRGRLTVEGLPAAGALVFVKDSNYEPGLCDQQGEFEIIAQAGRDKTLVAFWGMSHGIQHTFSLVGGMDISLGEIKLQSAGVIRGTLDIVNPQDAELSIEGVNVFTHPEVNGQFSLVVPPGSWEIEIQAPGYKARQIENIGVSIGDVRKLEDLTLEEDPAYSCQASELRVDRYSQGGGGAIDILLVMDGSGSMVGEQMAVGRSFRSLAEAFRMTGVDFHIAVITNGIESDNCPLCTDFIANSCINETLENGRFQDRIGKNMGTEYDPDFVFESRSECRVVTKDNLDCLYDAQQEKGTSLVGIQGCGYERGLAAMRMALSPELIEEYNSGFLRPHARLVVIAFSDEDDCGEVGDVNETLPGIMADVCYYAAKGEDPEGNTVDPEGKPYQLTPVEDYYDFLLELKGSNHSLVSFGAIVGMQDPSDPMGSTIEYEWREQYNMFRPQAACEIPNCNGIDAYCTAQPGTRYIKLADMLGGKVNTICQQDFAGAVLDIAGVSTGVRNTFNLQRTPASVETIDVKVNQQLSNKWSYRPESQAIQFDPANVPGVYSQVEIEYQALCE
jgi:hypothetical protein